MSRRTLLKASIQKHSILINFAVSLKQEFYAKWINTLQWRYFGTKLSGTSFLTNFTFFISSLLVTYFWKNRPCLFRDTLFTSFLYWFYSRPLYLRAYRVKLSKYLLMLDPRKSSTSWSLFEIYQTCSRSFQSFWFKPLFGPFRLALHWFVILLSPGSAASKYLWIRPLLNPRDYLLCKCWKQQTDWWKIQKITQTDLESEKRWASWFKHKNSWNSRNMST